MLDESFSLVKLYVFLCPLSYNIDTCSNSRLLILAQSPGENNGPVLNHLSKGIEKPGTQQGLEITEILRRSEVSEG